MQQNVFWLLSTAGNDVLGQESDSEKILKLVSTSFEKVNVDSTVKNGFSIFIWNSAFRLANQYKKNLLFGSAMRYFNVDK